MGQATSYAPNPARNHPTRWPAVPHPGVRCPFHPQAAGIATSASTGFGKDQTLRYLASLRALNAEESAQLSAEAEEEPDSVF
jgi:hypothetical protein